MRTLGRTGLLVAAALTASIASAGCVGAAASPGTAASAAAPKAYRIDLIVGVTNNPFYTSMVKGAEAMANKLGATLSVDGSPEWSPTRQTPILNAVIARHPDAIIFVPTDPTAMDAPLKAAVDAGIVTVTADTDVATAANRIVNYASDNVEGGRMAAQALLEQIGGKGKVFLLNAIPGETTSVDRQKGFEEGLAQAIASGQVAYLPVQFSQEDQQKGTAIIAAVLQANPDLAGIFAEDTINGQAAAVAVQNAGLAGKVKVVAFDASPEEVDALKAGTFSALIAQKPYDMGGLAVQAAIDYLGGAKAKYTGQVVRTGYVVMTGTNISDPEVSKFVYPLNQ